MKIPRLPKNEVALLNRIAKVIAPATLFLVGGTVRDLLLHRPTRDFDVVICGLPLKKTQRLLRRFGTVHEMGSEFGVLRLFPQKLDAHIDIALPRTERGRGTGGYRDFSFRPDPRLSIETDLSRRDFTVNAMALSWPQQTLIDPHHGQRDCSQKLLRTVGDSRERFGEDYSRILRLFRFSAELGFSIEHETGAAAHRLARRLNAKRDGAFLVPREVIAEQLIRTFSAQPLKAFDVYDRYGIFPVLLPEVAALHGCRQPERYHAEGDSFLHTRLALKNLMSAAYRRTFSHVSVSPLVVFATLLHDIGKPKTKRVIREHKTRRIHFWGHDAVGASMTAAIAERLKLASYNGLVPTRDLAWLVRSHLVVTTNDVRGMRAATLAKYFTGRCGQELLQVIWADQSASLHPSGKAALEGFTETRKRLKKLFGSHTTPKLPRPLLSGKEVMRMFGLLEGPIIGSLLRVLHDAQIERRVRTKAQARALLRNSLRLHV